MTDGRRNGRRATARDGILSGMDVTEDSDAARPRRLGAGARPRSLAVGAIASCALLWAAPDLAAAPRAGDAGDDARPAERAAAAEITVLRAEDGRPLAGARITDAAGTRVGSTDAEGRCALPPPAAGARYLVAAPGRVPVAVDAARYAALTGGAGAALALEKAADLEVVIYDARGGVLPDAEVVLRGEDDGALLFGAEEEEWSARTDARGRARFSQLPASSAWRARVRHDGRLLREIERTLRFEDERVARVGWIVDPGRDRTGRALDESGDPVVGARLWVVENDDDPFARRDARWIVEGAGPPVRVVETDERGRFTLSDLPHGWYRVGPAPGEGFVALGAPLEHDLRDEPRAVRLRLDAGAPLDGTVEASDGSPLAGALVRVRVAGTGGVAAVRADDRGRFRLRVPAGRPLRLEAVDERFGLTSRLAHVAAGTTRVALRFE